MLGSRWTAALVLVLFYAALALGLREKSATLDEPGHAIAGTAYWKFGDYRLDPENGNFPQRVIGLPLALGGFQFPDRAGSAWQNRDIYSLADQWLYEMGNDFHAILRRGRAAAALVAVALGTLVWWWSRRLFGPPGGLLSLLVYVLNPTILANGGLMTSDTTSAFGFLLSLYAVSMLLERLTVLRVAASGLAMGLLFVAKMSAVVIIPVALLLAAIRIFDPRPLALDRGRPLDTAGRRATGLGCAALVHVGAVAFVIWLFFGFRFSAFAPGEGGTGKLDWAEVFDGPDPLSLVQQTNLDAAQIQRANVVLSKYAENSRMTSQAAAVAANEIRQTILSRAQNDRFEQLQHDARPSLALRLVHLALEHRMLPEAYLYGFAHVWKLTGARFAFFNGAIKVNDGWFWFFPYTILVKTPLAFFALLVFAVVAHWPRGERIRATARAALHSNVLPLVLFVLVYLAAAIGSKTNIGHRHLLPIYPALFVLCGSAATFARVPREDETIVDAPRRSVWSTRVIAALVGVLAVECIAWFPHYLSYFNGLVLPSHGYRHLVDSSLDWGQDLPAVRTYIDERNPPRPLYIAQFGRGTRPDRYGIPALRIAGGVTHPFVTIADGAAATHRAQIEDYLRQHPEYDRIIASVRNGNDTQTVLLRKPADLRLTGGTYFISATALQPLSLRTLGPWTADYEAKYQRGKKIIAPLLSDDPNTRLSVFESRPMAELLRTYEEFIEFRFARLTAYLRQRAPDDNIHYSILVYRLSDAEVARALEGPPP